MRNEMRRQVYILRIAQKWAFLEIWQFLKLVCL